MPTELKHYLDQPLLERTANPVSFWIKEYSLVYPSLSIIAKKYLVVVATSVQSERLFSRAGNILTDCRSRLSPEHLQQLLFLNSLPIKDWQLK